MRLLLLMFVLISALEIGVFIWAGNLIGPWWIVVIIFLTGALGISVAKRQGVETWNRARESMADRRVPAVEIMDGICIFVGAVLLFAPGFITDLIGFLLIIPFTRGPFKLAIGIWIKRMVSKGRAKGTIIYRK